jgi:hypothetical protein
MCGTGFACQSATPRSSRLEGSGVKQMAPGAARCRGGRMDADRRPASQFSRWTAIVPWARTCSLEAPLPCPGVPVGGSPMQVCEVTWPFLEQVRARRRRRKRISHVPTQAQSSTSKKGTTASTYFSRHTPHRAPAPGSPRANGRNRVHGLRPNHCERRSRWLLVSDRELSMEQRLLRSSQHLHEWRSLGRALG